MDSREVKAKTKRLVSQLRALGDKERAERSRSFFKTGPGQYGEGDVFLGIPVPALRELLKKHPELAAAEALELLRSPYHEARFLALLLLVSRYRTARSPGEREKIYRAYLEHTAFINSWDLVDGSAEHIVGGHLFRRDRRPLRRLAASKSLWERRISVLATFYFIRRGEYADFLEIARSLLDDEEDLIHKAVGWLLREVGKRAPEIEREFLTAHYRRMPRTMLRYAIEKFPEKERLAYLCGEI